MSQVILLSFYELGHQPLSLAWPLAALERADIDAAAYDLAITDFPTDQISQAKLVALTVPMHTALRLGLQAAERIRIANPQAHICFYGLYAGLNASYLLTNYADSILSGEVEDSLVALAESISSGQQPRNIPGLSTRQANMPPTLKRLDFPIPSRQTLPRLTEYAHYTVDGTRHLAGYVEASRGCLHTCAHCPITPIYQGRFFIVPIETVLADIRQQVDAGAGHITFGDPDFLNGPGHALKIARALHAEFPHVTFNFTTKVEHIIEQRADIPEFAALGCTFIVSAFEATSDHILQRLNKGHTRAQMEESLSILAQAGIAPEPTWMPFTPWTSLNDYLDLLAWIRAHDLIPHTPAVQLGVRMLVPPGSALLKHPDVDSWAGALDTENFTHLWAHPDPGMDELHQTVMAIAEKYLNEDNYQIFERIEAAAHHLSGRPQPIYAIPAPNTKTPPKLTENWFC